MSISGVIVFRTLFLSCVFGVVGNACVAVDSFLDEMLQIEDGQELAEKTIAKEVAVEYRGNWREIPGQQVTAYHPFHKQQAFKVVELHSHCNKDESNTAAFGVTIYLSNNRKEIIPFDKVVSSGKVDNINNTVTQ